MPDLLKKSLLILATILIYFLGVRELRQELKLFYQGTILPIEFGGINENLSFYSQSSVSFTFCEVCEDYGKGWLLKMPFDSFLLFGTIGLIIIGATVKDFAILASIQFGIGILSILLLIAGLNLSNVFLVLIDFLSRYMLPLSSLGWVALVLAQNRNQKSEKDAEIR